MSESGKGNETTKQLAHYAKLSARASKISPREYLKYDVKRGLRNANGTGVNVGVTRISSVTGYRTEGEKVIPEPGKMYYRGIDVEELVAGLDTDVHTGYEEVVYLLLFDELPTWPELREFESYLNDERHLPENFKENVILNQPSNNIMNYLQRMILALYSYSEDPENTSPESLLKKGLQILAKMPTMIAYGYMAQQHYYNNQSLVLHAPIYASSAENILHMVRQDTQYTAEEARLLDLLLVVHAEHGGGNNSAFTTNVISSSGTDIFSTISAAVGSLKGVKHGGANLKATKMIDDILEHVSDPRSDAEIETYLRRVLDGKAFDRSGIIYGMGHAVYTLSDPRAQLLKRGLEKLAQNNPRSLARLHVAQRVEAITRQLMKEKKGSDFEICANIDLYSGIVYQMLNIPPTLYTPIFAAARIAGWLAHILEQTSDGKIMRPAYIALQEDAQYIPISERKRGGHNHDLR
ncbi:hypothetical protein ACU19_06245 [Actinobaculum suis]|uniref:citrate synthase n=1 Tax=Actinobaculum suis TaxID=1657 RepID=UPI00066FFAAE|nr:citrate synthase [Actinobaculum suis]KMY23061.1 hypothetical protein ACU19_06245 [Actinobaculum suis]